MLKEPGPAILAFLTSDPARTTLDCKILERGFAATVQIEIKFPSGETRELGAALRVPEETQALLVKGGYIEGAREVTLAMKALKSGDVGGAEKTLMGTMVHLDQGKK